MTAKKTQTPKIVHPVLFGLYPVLFLMSANLGEIPSQESWRSVVVVFLISIALWFLLKIALRDNQKAALIATLLLFSFFTYGHFYNYLGQEVVFGGVLKRHRFLVPIIALIILVSSWWIIKKVRDLNPITQVFNMVGMVLIIFPVYQISSFEIRSFSQDKENQRIIAESSGGSLSSSTNDKPDIYYIILDTYGRDDDLLELYGYDNSWFLNALEEKGFYVAYCSNSNYGRTQLSLPSSLNMNYIEKIGGDDLKKDSRGNLDLVKIRRLVVDNEVRRVLESNNYSTVAFQTGFYWTTWDNADYFFLYSDGTEKELFASLFHSFNEYESLLLETTAGKLFLDFINTVGAASQGGTGNTQAVFDGDTRQEIRYNAVKYTLDTLEEIPSLIESPKFVFVHLLSPHRPFLFDADGNFVSDVEMQEQIVPGYLDQMTYINKRVLTIVENIIQTSERPPVIIIQGDHGPPGTKYTPDRLPILNAYYLPDGGNELLYNSITPVNSFRLIFDYYFGTEYGLLDDISHNSTEKETFNFKIVPNTCNREGP